MAEIEFSIFSRCCLWQGLPDDESLRREVHAPERESSEARAVINWGFTTQDTIEKRDILYPSIASLTRYWSN